MKKLLLICLISWIAVPICYGAYSRLLFSNLAVNSDGSWSVSIQYSDIADTLTLISGADTVRFTFTEQQMADINKYYESNNEFRVYGNLTSSKLESNSVFFDLSIISSDVLHLDQSCDSLEVLFYYYPTNPEMPYRDNYDIVRYGGDFFLPSFTDMSSLNLNIALSWAPSIGTCRLVKDGRTISPYVLTGKVYDSRGLPVRKMIFKYSMYSGESSYYPEFWTDVDGNYTFEWLEKITGIYSISFAMIGYDKEMNIQPIILGKPFGDTINVDIHLLGPLAEGEDAPEAIAVQRSGSILHVSGGVREIALIDARGRSLSYTRSADVDIEQLPAGIYYLSVTLADGRMLRHPFNK